MAPAVEKKIIQSWGEVMEEDGIYCPPPKEVISGNNKIVTEFRKEEGKMIKYVKTYKKEKIRISKNVARRKNLSKFGAAKDDPRGPNPANTLVCEEVLMQFIMNADDEQLENARDLDQDGLSKLISSNANVVKCRLCEMDHWTSKCPYKIHYENREQTSSTTNNVERSNESNTSNKYIPPSKREGGGKGGESLSMNKREDYTVRITNLPEEIQDSDIKDLFKDIGDISRIFLARDKITGQSKGFAFVSFRTKAHAAKAIQIVNGFGYANLILNVEWAKPSNQ